MDCIQFCPACVRYRMAFGLAVTALTTLIILSKTNIRLARLIVIFNHLRSPCTYSNLYACRAEKLALYQEYYTDLFLWNIMPGYHPCCVNNIIQLMVVKWYVSAPLFLLLSLISFSFSIESTFHTSLNLVFCTLSCLHQIDSTMNHTDKTWHWTHYCRAHSRLPNSTNVAYQQFQLFSFIIYLACCPCNMT